MNSKNMRTLNVQTNTMADRCERCVGGNVPPDLQCSNVVGYSICEECYDELRAEEYEAVYNWQYED
jgi:hypothetical protein